MIANAKKSMTVQFSNIRKCHVPMACNQLHYEWEDDSTCLKNLIPEGGDRQPSDLKNHLDIIVPVLNIRQLYVAYIRPIITYACSSWFSIKSQEQ
jgi:hypothetical protein